MLDPEDSDKLFTEEGNIIGYVATDSGGLLLVDGIWRSVVPKSKDQMTLELDGPSRQRIPVRALRKDGKRFLILAIDEGQELGIPKETVEIE